MKKVSTEVKKLLQIKNFPFKTKKVRVGRGESTLGSLFGTKLYKNINIIPTQSELQTWLRENHNININIRHKTFNQTYGYDITGNYHEGERGVLKSYDFKGFEEYEQALEDGLLEALRLIK